MPFLTAPSFSAGAAPAAASVSFHSIDAVDFRDGGLDRAASLLDADERERAARLRPARHRARWVVAHALQRRELATHLGCPPQAIRFERSPFGRPSLAAPAGVRDGLDFNISHSGDVLLIGITGRGRIGVDVEAWVASEAADRTPLWESLSAREGEWVAEQADPFAAFVRLWTRKEAIVKALGTGLPDHLAALDVLPQGPADGALVATPNGPTVRVLDIPSPPGFHAAVALTEPDIAVQLVAGAPAFTHATVLA